MGTITWTREAKCKDCEFFRYYYEGKRKFHKCSKKNINVTTKDKPWCGMDLFELRESYYPKKLEE